LALLRDLEDLELTFRRYALLNKNAFQYLLYHLPSLRRLALRRCFFRFPDISVIFSQPPLVPDLQIVSWPYGSSEVSQRLEKLS
jgi:hypothetical protein